MGHDTARQYAEAVLLRRAAAAEAKREEFYRTLYREHPYLEQLDSRIARIGASAALAAAKGGAAADELCELDVLQNEREHYLNKCGIREESFFHCPHCRDTGRVRGAPCDCYRQLIREYHAKQINSRSPLALTGFESFSLDCYSDIAEKGRSTRQKMAHNLEVCKRFAYKDRTAPRNLLLFGYAGLGKTHLALAIAHERIAAGEDVIYCSSANIFREIEREYMADFRNDTVLRELKACDLLILDDLGSEYLNAVVLNAIYDLVNTRISEGKSTVFTTNLVEQKQLEARYGESITSRLLGCCEKLAFDGEEDIRRLPIRPPKP